MQPLSPYLPTVLLSMPFDKSPWPDDLNESSNSSIAQKTLASSIIDGLDDSELFNSSDSFQEYRQSLITFELSLAKEISPLLWSV
jgi:hypothetical protein